MATLSSCTGGVAWTSPNGQGSSGNASGVVSGASIPAASTAASSMTVPDPSPNSSPKPSPSPSPAFSTSPTSSSTPIPSPNPGSVSPQQGTATPVATPLDYVPTNLIADWEVSQAEVVASPPGTTLADQGPNGYDALLNGATWSGNGSSNSPYSVTVGTSSSVNFYGNPLMGMTQMMFTSWIAPSVAFPPASSAVILGNSAGATGNGFTLRSSATQNGKLELVVGMSYQDTVMADKANKPVAYWRLSDPSGSTTAIDISGNGNDGTYSGGVAPGASGLLTGDIDSAASFDGTTGLVNVPGAVMNETVQSGQGAVEVWLKPSIAQETLGASVFSYNSTPGSIEFDYRENFLSITYHGSNYSYGQCYNPVLNANQLAHLVFNYNLPNKTFAIYQNGISLCTGDFVDNGTDLVTLSLSPNGTAAIAYSITQTAYYPGILQELAVYSKPLTSAQVSQHYITGLGQQGGLCRSNSSFSPGVWNFVGGILDGSNLQLFVNGQLECQVPQNPGFPTNVSTPNTKLVSGGSNNSWSGSLADLKLYGTNDGTIVGTPSDISTNFTLTSARFQPSPAPAQANEVSKVLGPPMSLNFQTR